MQHDRREVRGWLARVAFVGIMFVIAGCDTPRRVLVDGLPGDQYFVGGGMMIDWKAPSAGTAYLVEKTAGKIIETRSMEAGDNFGFSIGAGAQRTEFEKRVGTEFSDMDLRLYFVPADAGATRYTGAR